jgi:hypothetical protein
MKRPKQSIQDTLRQRYGFEELAKVSVNILRSKWSQPISLA